MTLALKYRPQRLEDFSGQDHVVKVMGKMLERHRAGELELPSGLILTGAWGSGKTSMARVVAAWLNCEGDDPPCGDCLHCRAIHNFTSDSVLELDGATSGLVEDVRQLRQTARLSHSGKYRVIVIDEVHSMSTPAFSALLKQLEEPPPHVLYVLVTTDFHQIPSTVSSRCLVFTFAPVQPRKVGERLWHVCQQEGFEFDMPGLAYIAKRSKGAMRDALMMLEHATIAGTAKLEDVHDLWPDTLNTFAADYLESVAEGAMARGRELVRQTFGEVRDSGRMTDAVIDQLAKMAIESAEKGDRTRARALGGCIPHVWELRVKFRSAPAHDPTLVEGLWYVLAQEFGVIGKAAGAALAKQNGAQGLRPPVVDEDRLPAAAPAPSAPPPEADTLTTLENIING